MHRVRAVGTALLSTAVLTLAACGDDGGEVRDASATSAATGNGSGIAVDSAARENVFINLARRTAEIVNRTGLSMRKVADEAVAEFKAKYDLSEVGEIKAVTLRRRITPGRDNDPVTKVYEDTIERKSTGSS